MHARAGAATVLAGVLAWLSSVLLLGGVERAGDQGGPAPLAAPLRRLAPASALARGPGPAGRGSGRTATPSASDVEVPVSEVASTPPVESGVQGESVGCGGGTPRSWLARHQDPDGGWSARGWACACASDPPGALADDLARAALSLVALVRAGHTHRFGREKAVVRRGLGWLEARLLPAGPDGPPARLATGERALATWALAELHACSRDARLRPRVRAALEHLAGSWAGGAVLDPLTTGWVLLALGAARQAGLEPPPLDLRLEGRTLAERALRALATRAGGSGLAASQRQELLAEDPLADRDPGPEPTVLVALALGTDPHPGVDEWFLPRLGPHRLDATDGCAGGSRPPGPGGDRVRSTALDSILHGQWYARERARRAMSVEGAE